MQRKSIQWILVNTIKSCLSLHCNGAKILLVKKLAPTAPLCLRNVSKDFSVDNMKKDKWYRYPYDFSALCKKRPYSELFWSVFSCIRTECKEIFRISSYLIRMRENTYQNNSEYGHFLRSGVHYDAISIDNILDIHKYLMKKHDI